MTILKLLKCDQCGITNTFSFDDEGIHLPFGWVENKEMVGWHTCPACASHAKPAVENNERAYLSRFTYHTELKR